MGADDLVQRVLDDRNRQAGRDRVNARAVLLRLLDRRVHEHRAARAEVDRVLGEQAELAELLDRVAHRAGKGLDKRAAARGTCLVERDIVDALVADLEALDVLAADVDDKVDIRAEVARRAEVGDRFDQAEVHAEGMLDERLAVARDRARHDMYAVAAQLIQAGQLLADDVRRVALVGLIVVEQDLVILADQHELGRGRAAVDAEVCVALVHGDVLGHHVVHAVAVLELLILLLVFKQRRQVVGNHRRVRRALERGEQRIDRIGFLGVLCIFRRARCDGKRGKVGEVGVCVVQPQGFLETVLQALEEEQRAAEEQHIALDLASLREAGDRLVDHGLENRCRDVLLARAVIEERLDVRLGEHAAAGCDGIDLLCVLGKFVQLGRRHVEQHRHLVDEGARAARARAVHALLQLAGQEHDLGVLAAQLDDHVRLRHVHADRLAGGKHFLHEVDVRGLGDAEARRARDRTAQRGVRADGFTRILHQLNRLFAHLGEVALIVLVDDLSIAHDHDLDRGRTDIDTYIYVHIS